MKLTYNEMILFLEGAKLIDEVDLNYIIKKGDRLYKIDGKNVIVYSSSDGILLGVRHLKNSVYDLIYNVVEVFHEVRLIPKIYYTE